ncbi:ABC transporter ATP-binding protein [Kitasatospora terrestris]|uniref:ATP-binding cassette domain-containing protein n=1 Tax=Kitasatospora terrestris TaxID=258051 RepID=A0ABP9DDI9_9ACTN
MPAIEARGLVKTFRSVVRKPGVRGGLRALLAPEYEVRRAVEDVSFAVEQGELLALLGPNGAGKSTTIKMLTGILTPSAGSAVVGGVVPYLAREANARNIGAVFGQRTQLWWDLPARESFRILRDIYGVGASAHAARLAELDSLLGISAFWNTRVRHLSLGQRVLCDLSAALLHDPPVLFLDEPTIGMDIVVKEKVRALLRHEVEQRGRTVLLTTHDVSEVERLAGRVVIVNHGRVVLDGTLEHMRQRFGSGWQVHATVVGTHRRDGAAGCPRGLAVVRSEGSRTVFEPLQGADVLSPHEALGRIIERYEVTDISIEQEDLEQVLRAAYLDARPGVRTA